MSEPQKVEEKKPEGSPVEKRISRCLACKKDVEYVVTHKKQFVGDKGKIRYQEGGNCSFRSPTCLDGHKVRTFVKGPKGEVKTEEVVIEKKEAPAEEKKN